MRDYARESARESARWVILTRFPPCPWLEIKKITVTIWVMACFLILDFDSVLERIYSIQIFAGFWYHSESLKNHLILHFRSKFINRHCVVTRFLDLTFRQSFLEITFKQFDTVFISKLYSRISETISKWEIKDFYFEMKLKWT